MYVCVCTVALVCEMNDQSFQQIATLVLAGLVAGVLSLPRPERSGEDEYHELGDSLEVSVPASDSPSSGSESFFMVI